MPRAPLRVTVVGGRLGAGKTTVLNNILAHAVEKARVAVFVNEFGSIDVDGALLAMAGRVPGDDIVTLDDGCVCCEVNASLIAAVQRLVEEVPDAEYLVVETSGVARLGPVVDTFLQTDLSALTRLDAVIYVADTDRMAHGDESAAVVQGLTPCDEAEHADVVLLNKIDLVQDAACVETLEDNFRAVCRQAVLVRTERGKLPVEALLDFDHASGAVAQPKRKRARIAEGPAREHGNPFTSFAYARKAMVDADKFERLVEEDLPKGIYRAKGFLHYPDVPQSVVFQMTGRRTNGFETDPRKDLLATGTRLVFIGRDFDAGELERKLDACLVQKSTSE